MAGSAAASAIPSRWRASSRCPRTASSNWSTWPGRNVFNAGTAGAGRADCTPSSAASRSALRQATIASK
jgi:hypothetical protein